MRCDAMRCGAMNGNRIDLLAIARLICLAVWLAGRYTRDRVDVLAQTGSMQSAFLVSAEQSRDDTLHDQKYEIRVVG